MHKVRKMGAEWKGHVCSYRCLAFDIVTISTKFCELSTLICISSIYFVSNIILSHICYTHFMVISIQINFDRYQSSIISEASALLDVTPRHKVFDFRRSDTVYRSHLY